MPQSSKDIPTMYLDLLERALTHTLYQPIDRGIAGHRYTRALKRLLRQRGILTIFVSPDDAAAREEGRDWPVFAHTMIGTRRLSHLRSCVEQLLRDEITGDLIEAGVWRGGASILMRGILRAQGIEDRMVWVADSFAGLPRPDAHAHPADAGAIWHKWTELAVTRAEVEANFRNYGLLDERVRFLEGWFSDTLPGLVDRTWALIRLDADMYGSTTDALSHLYPRLSVGGYVIVDDYFAVPACRLAVDAYRDQQEIVEPIQRIDWAAAFWRRGRSAEIARSEHSDAGTMRV
jgi:O-methyltransferase